MSEETAVITRSKAISLINISIENFATYYDGYCSLNKENLTEEETALCQQTGEVVYILRNDKNYRRDLEQMPLEDLTDFFLSCKEMVNFHDLLEKFSFPKEQVMIVEDTNINPELIEKSLEKLEQHGDVKINNAIKEYHEGERKIRFSKMPENQYGETWYINDKYSHFITENLIQDTPENQIKIAVTLAHEFKRNAQTDSISGETRDIVLEDTKIIESFANTYGEEIYKKFPEYGILHYIKKIFGEAELKDFADFAFDSTGNYWKVNGKGDLEDNADVSKVMDVNGKQLYSDTTGRQGTLENWLGISNAFITLLKPAGYEYDSEKKTWSKVPGKISHEIIEKAYKNGELTQDQYNLIQLAAGKSVSQNDESGKVNLFRQVLDDIQKANEIRTQVQIDMANRAREWICKKWNLIFGKKEKKEKSDNSFYKAIQENENIKEERKWKNNEHHCDEYCEAVLKSANKLPEDWPGTDYIVSSNDNGKNKKSFMGYYRSKLKNSPEPGWNLMLMDGHTRTGNILPPHMLVLYLRDDGLIDFSHYTSDQVMTLRKGWTLEEMTDTGKDGNQRLGYSNFKYLPLGK